MSRVLTVNDLGIVQANTTDHLHGCVVMDGRDARLREELGAQLCIADTKSELLLL